MDDTARLIESLDDAQHAAVTTRSRHTLVLGGAGSGKTHTLARRAAWLIATKQATRSGILVAVSTRKTADRVHKDVETVLRRTPDNVRNMQIGTFHKLANRICREAGEPRYLKIITQNDQLRLVRHIMHKMDFNEERHSPKQAQNFINARKGNGVRARHLPASGNLRRQWISEVYRAYETKCTTSGLADFAELLLQAWEVLRERRGLLAKIRNGYEHLLADELENMTAVQYELICLLASNPKHLFVVGDDDQSIHGWRGARVENVRKLARDFEGITTYRLKNSYRSTRKILAAANAVIANNANRFAKSLRTARSEDEPVRRYSARDEVEEAHFVVRHIEHACHEGSRLDDHAVLYRKHAQSPVIEQALRKAAIHYRRHASGQPHEHAEARETQPLHERTETKNAMAYLRLVASHDDDDAFRRAANVPPRGIEGGAMLSLRKHARNRSCSLWAAALDLGRGDRVAGHAGTGIRELLQIVERLGEHEAGRSLDELVAMTVQDSGLAKHYRRKHEKIESLNELAITARHFEDRSVHKSDTHKGSADRALVAFIRHTAPAVTQSFDRKPRKDAVQLMTMHAAKGLAFETVFMVGMEEGLLPLRSIQADPNQLEAERRLCYVAMTCAKRRLYLVSSRHRQTNGKRSRRTSSRFLHEIPSDLIEDTGTPESLEVGQRVRHGKFGKGTILNRKGDGAKTVVQIDFPTVGPTWLLVARAELERL